MEDRSLNGTCFRVWMDIHGLVFLLAKEVLERFVLGSFFPI